MILTATVRRYRERPWWDAFVAVGTFGIALVLYATDLYAISPENQLPLWVLIGQSGVLCVAQMFRRKAPLAMLALATGILLADLAYNLTLPVIMVFIDLLFNATLHTTRRASRLIFVFAITIVMGVAITAGVVTGNWRNGFFAFQSVFSLLIVPVWWSFNIRQHEEILAAERASTRQLRRIAELDRRTAVAAERAQMARDLHDVVAGHLSAIAIQSEALLSTADRDPQVVRTVLKSVRENSIQSLAEMRAMIDVLRADGDDDPRTAPARLAEMDRLVDSARAGGLVLEVHRAVGDELPVAVDLAAYRIVQEALTNALKHAGGGGATVDVRVAEDQLIIEVTNDLTGSPAAADGTGTGLVSMRERAHAVGGDFEAGPWSGGWRVRAVLPIGGTAS